MSRDAVPDDQRVFEHGIGFIRSDLHDGADRFALDLWIGVVEHRRELGQRFAAAEHPQQIDGGAAHRRIGRVFQLFDGLASRGAEPEQQLPEIANRAVVFFRGQGNREGTYHARTDRVADAGQRLDVLLLGLPQMEDDVADNLSRGELVQHRFSCRPQRGPPSSLRSATSMLSSVCAVATSPSNVRRSISSVATAAMACHAARFAFNTEQILNQREIECANSVIADAREPCLHAFGWIVGDTFDFDRLGACA